MLENGRCIGHAIRFKVQISEFNLNVKAMPKPKSKYICIEYLKFYGIFRVTMKIFTQNAQEFQHEHEDYTGFYS